jgi:hypothetical protein
MAWLLAMLHDVGGWSRYRAQSADFARSAGYLNSIWHLGLVDAPLRYSVKLGMALIWTFGPALLIVPRGLLRVTRREDHRALLFLLALSVLPAIASHLLVHFGVPGYAFHYVPALLVLVALGIGRTESPARTNDTRSVSPPAFVHRAPARLVAVAALLAALFLFYPTDFEQPGWRGAFDLSFARHTRIGLHKPIPDRQPTLWRTANSRQLAGTASARRSRIAPSL